MKPNGVFDIRSFYNKLRDSSSTIFPWKAIWKAKAPRRVSFFVWCVAWNKILTRDNLRLRRMVFVDWCIMCRHCGETVDHLLLHCEMAYRLWSFVFITFGLSWVIPRSIPDLLFGWWNWLGKHLSQIWNLVPLCILWCIWKERNQRTFEDLVSPVIKCLLLLVELFLIGLERGDSHLVIPSLLFFAPFLFCNFSIV